MRKRAPSRVLFHAHLCIRPILEWRVFLSGGTLYHMMTYMPHLVSNARRLDGKRNGEL